jgi:hypothetical protein
MRPIRQSVVEIRPLFQERQCTELVDWAERQGLPPWAGGAESTALSRRVVDELLRAGLWPCLAEAIRLALCREPVRFAGPAFIDRFDAGQRLLPAAGSGIEIECPHEETEEPFGICGRCRETTVVVMAFLNDAFAGGEFVYHLYDGPVTVEPAAGAALVFPAFLTCEDAPVREGCKYVLRVAVKVAEL